MVQALPSLLFELCLMYMDPGPQYVVGFVVQRVYDGSFIEVKQLTILLHPNTFKTILRGDSTDPLFFESTEHGFCHFPSGFFDSQTCMVFVT